MFADAARQILVEPLLGMFEIIPVHVPQAEQCNLLLFPHSKTRC